MFLRGLGTAHPTHRYTKADCWEAFKTSPWFARVDERARLIVETVLQRDNGIEARRLAIDTLDEVFEIDPDTLHARFVKHAPALACEAAERALVDANLDAVDIDGIVVSTCTGYLCPGLTGYVIEQLNLRRSVAAFDLVGQGCAAALPNWRMADALLASRQCSNVLSVCVEVSSAAMYLDNDPGVPGFTRTQQFPPRRCNPWAVVLAARPCWTCRKTWRVVADCAKRADATKQTLAVDWPGADRGRSGSLCGDLLLVARLMKPVVELGQITTLSPRKPTSSSPPAVTSVTAAGHRCGESARAGGQAAHRGRPGTSKRARSWPSSRATIRRQRWARRARACSQRKRAWRRRPRPAWATQSCSSSARNS